MHGQLVTEWAVLSVQSIVGPLFFEDAKGNVGTINKNRYLNMQKRKFIPALRSNGINIDIWLQQDAATTHTHRLVMRFKGYQEWLPHSPD